MSKLGEFPGRVMHSWLTLQLSQVPGAVQAVRPRQNPVQRRLSGWHTRLAPAEGRKHGDNIGGDLLHVQCVTQHIPCHQVSDTCSTHHITAAPEMHNSACDGTYRTSSCCSSCWHCWELQARSSKQVTCLGLAHQQFCVCRLQVRWTDPAVH
jgi:hypothetical protein